MSSERQLARALQLHEAGDLLGAGEIYREILAADPENVDALNLMGVVMHAAGDFDLAIELTRQATELAPDYFAPFVNLGNAQQAAGRARDAVTSFEAALALNPQAALAASNMSSALNDLGDHADALAAADGALVLMGDLPDAHVNRGNALLGLGRLDEALKSFTEALDFDPTHGAAWYNLGNAYIDAGCYEDALGPLRKAAAADPTDPERHYNLGNVLLKLDRYSEAAESFETALNLKPGYTDALCNLASAWQSVGRTADAVESLKSALAKEPESIDLHWNLSLALLQHGDMRNGWREYEWRWQTPTFAEFRREFSAPEWDGRKLDGETLFVHAEQGFGDALQFVRYVTPVAERGARVVLECRPELQRLFATLPDVSACIPLGGDAGHFDFHIPLMSLPRVFDSAEDTLPRNVPYLQPPARRIIDDELGTGQHLRVGIVWSGSPTRRDNHRRSCPLASWHETLLVPGVRFYSLQVGDAAAELRTVRDVAPIVDLAPRVTDFADTAAAVNALDLVISVDTSVLHLAGALGKAAWALLSQPTGFLWMNDRADSPWYPTLRLFRQAAPGDWASVMGPVSEVLRERVAKQEAME